MISRIVSDLRKRGIKFVFVIFDLPEDIYEPLKWRNEFLIELFGDLKVTCISARQVLQSREPKDTFEPSSYWFSPEDHHPNLRYNRLVAHEIARWAAAAGEPGNESLKYGEK